MRCEETSTEHGQNKRNNPAKKWSEHTSRVLVLEHGCAYASHPQLLVLLLLLLGFFWYFPVARLRAMLPNNDCRAVESEVDETELLVCDIV